MRAMVMAAGLGTRLRPLTGRVAKPMLPVCNRPVLEHILRLLRTHGVEEAALNLHFFPDPIRELVGDGSEFGLDIRYSFEERLLGTAGGVRNIADWLSPEGEPFYVMAGDALTDIDLRALGDAHRSNDGIATLAVKRVGDASEYGVVIAGDDGRIQGFQEKPAPGEELSELANCMIYVLEREIFDHFPDREEVDFALDVFPLLLEGDIPFHLHEIDGYWNDIGSLPEFLQGNLDAIEGAVRLPDFEPPLEGSPELDRGAQLAGDVEISGRVLVGADAEICQGARVIGPAVIGPGACVCSGAVVKEAVLLGGASVPEDGILARGIAASARSEILGHK